MKRLIKKTNDGSHTVFHDDLKESFHSSFGALTESKHVFIQSGLLYFNKPELTLLEIGLGTGLNTLLTGLEAEKKFIKINYYAVEKYPLEDSILTALNYPEILGPDSEQLFKKIHEIPWGEICQISDYFNLKKIQGDLITIEFTEKYDLIYFDAFSPEVQPEMWDKTNFQKIIKAMNPGGILTTYSSKGSVRRTLAAVGFKLERIPGPPGKREMLRAWLPAN